jgi:hypothetical protein
MALLKSGLSASELRLVRRLHDRDGVGLPVGDAQYREVHPVAERGMDVALVVHVAADRAEEVGDDLPGLRVEIRVRADIRECGRRDEIRRVGAGRRLG